MGRDVIRRCAIGIVAWLPFFVLWTAVAMSSGQITLRAALAGGLISMGSAGLLGILVWFACERWRWPLGFSLSFYVLQIVLAVVYGATWTVVTFVLDYLRGAAPGVWSWPAMGRQTLLGIWFYAVLAGISHAVQTRKRLHENETLAARAEALASAARLDALRARLNPHFLFNALHTLSAVVRFRPALAESAIERLGDMLRYTLKEDGSGVVDFSEEYDFTRPYLAFEQLRYEDRLAVNLDVDPAPSSSSTCRRSRFRRSPKTRCTTRLRFGPRADRSGSRAPGGMAVFGSASGTMVLASARQGESDQQLGLRSVRERLLAAFGIVRGTAHRPQPRRISGPLRRAAVRSGYDRCEVTDSI